jgi:DNA-binding XRE family transcriptional regulator
MTETYGPTSRPDAAPLHPNVIRRFREELRLNRQQFAQLLDEKIDTLRVWEGGTGAKPRGEKAVKIVELANRNNYPLTITDIFPPASEKKAAPKKKKRVAKKKR